MQILKTVQEGERDEKRIRYLIQNGSPHMLLTASSLGLLTEADWDHFVGRMDDIDAEQILKSELAGKFPAHVQNHALILDLHST